MTKTFGYPSVSGRFSIRALDDMSRERTPIERSSTFEILWIHRGDGMLTIDTVAHQLVPRNIFALAPGQVIDFRDASKLSGYQISIDVGLMQLVHNPSDLTSSLWMAVGSNRPIGISDDNTEAELKEIVLLIRKELEKGVLANSEILNCYLKVVLIIISRVSEINGERLVYRNSNRDIALKFIGLVKQQIAHRKLVADYADALCITRSYLNFIVKKHTGLTAREYIQQHVISEAKRHALYSGLRMKEIAINLGFEDQAHFSRYFKAHAGTNFSVFKRSAGQRIVHAQNVVAVTG